MAIAVVQLRASEGSERVSYFRSENEDERKGEEDRGCMQRCSVGHRVERMNLIFVTPRNVDLSLCRGWMGLWGLEKNGEVLQPEEIQSWE